MLLFANLAQTDLGTCICDLTANRCDPDCCCDTSCTSEQIALFDTCNREGLVDDTVTTCAQLARVNAGLTSVSVATLGSQGVCVVRLNRMCLKLSMVL